MKAKDFYNSRAIKHHLKRAIKHDKKYFEDAIIELMEIYAQEQIKNICTTIEEEIKGINSVLEINKENIKTKEEILDNKFKERGIRKGWIGESKQVVLNAMDEYANEKLSLYHVKLSLQDEYKNEPTEHPQYEDDGKINGDTDNEIRKDNL